jgi:hypothetical protein
VIALQTLLETFLIPGTGREWRSATFFLLCAAGFLAGLRFVIAEHPFLAASSACIAAVLVYGALGTVNAWPGFRPPPDPDACPSCRYRKGHLIAACPDCAAAAEAVER